MPSRRIKSLRQGHAKTKDGVVWHREHRTKKGRNANYHMLRGRRIMRMKIKKRLEKDDERFLPKVCGIPISD